MWEASVLRLLYWGEAKDLSDSELNRCLYQCQIGVAKSMIKDNKLTQKTIDQWKIQRQK